MPNNSETKVKFNLWAVLAFLVLLGGLGFGYLLTAQSEDRTQHGVIADRHGVVAERTTRLEANYTHIINGINDIKIALSKTQEEVMALRIKTSKSKPRTSLHRDRNNP